MQFAIIMEKLCVLCELIAGVLNMIYSNIMLKSVQYLNFLCFSTTYATRFS